jgi:23S rRNA pseudouridine1911/1915/1917 synthase
VVADGLGCSRRYARYLARQGRVLVNGRPTAACGPVAAGAAIIVEPESPPPQLSAVSLESMRIAVDVDGEFAVFNKPAGLHSHIGRSPGSLAEMLIASDTRYAAAPVRREEGGLVHRLDRDTSGVMVAAATRDAYTRWRTLFKEARVSKWYLALVAGAVGTHMDIDTELARRKTGMVAARRHDRGLAARTEVDPLESHADWSLVQARTHTGVTHQVRAHLALRGHPIIGDMKYGDYPAPPGTRQGQLLHASRIKTDAGADFTAAVAADFARAYALLRRNRSQG